MRAVAYAGLFFGITLAMARVVLAGRLAPRAEHSIGELEYPFCTFCEAGVVGDDDERGAVRG